MDWNFKIPTWDFTEFENGTIPNIDLVSGSSSFEGQGIRGNFSVDLKLGNELEDGLKDSKMELSPSGSSKRARSINNAIQAASCVVDGCKADLSNCRKYHQRHKVCEVHSKTPQVSINGQKQRFCQQCSRFHLLEEFDEGKRSCRKRLDGHNRRRRKSQPDTPSQTKSLFPGHQGTTMLHFSGPQAYATMAFRDPLWTGIVNAEKDVTYTTRFSNIPQKQNPFIESSSSSNKVSGKQPFGLKNNTSPRKACDEYPPPAQVDQSGYAPSLLSSSSCTTPSNVVHPLASPFSVTASSLDHGLTYGGLMVPHGDDPDVGCNGHDAFHDHGALQTLPFYWE